MVNLLLKLLVGALGFVYGFSIFCQYAVIAIWKGTFFARPTEKENLELELGKLISPTCFYRLIQYKQKSLKFTDSPRQRIAKDRFWNLSKPWVGLSHRFLTLKSGFKFHYVCTEEPESPGTSASDKPLVIFIHGFPDSWAIWRHLLASSTIRDGSVVVAVDLPGFGGSDGMEKYGATEVLDSLTGFVIAIREHYGIENGEGGRSRKVVIVGHDWGCILAFRLATDAPQLADRFILTNGVLVSLRCLYMDVVPFSKLMSFLLCSRDCSNPTCKTSPHLRPKCSRHLSTILLILAPP